MATKAAATTAPQIEWPSNLTVQGQLSFPIKSLQEIEDLKAWRTKKEHPTPQFPDKIGGTLFLKASQWEKAKDYLIKEYLPFVDTLYKDTNGAKGISPEYVADLLAQAKDDVWIDPTDKKKRPNMPLRKLSAKDIENTGGSDSPYVGKIKFAGPYLEAPLQVAAIIMIDGKQKVVSIDELIEDGVLPDGHHDVDKLWFGAGWTFRTGLRFNAFDSASIGVAAYAQKIYLLPHLGLPVTANSSDSDVVEDGDDWDDES